MSKCTCVILFSLCAALIGRAQQTEIAVRENLVPAGTLLHCTLDESNFSSRTASVGDPLLCHVNSIEMFGRPLIPRGAYLSARLQEYRDPGRFFGKGWLQLEFVSLTLPGGNFPLNAKVISARKYRVDPEGKIRGHGHPTRDAIEWTIPLLWPMKVLTLPARGPRPALKGETRIELRLMEDLWIPESARLIATGLTTRSSPLLPNTEEREARTPAPQARNVIYRDIGLPAQPSMPMASASIGGYSGTQATNKTSLRGVQPVLILLALKGGRVYLVKDYWLDNGELEFTASAGTREALPLDALDVPLTTRLNAERGVTFVLTSNR